MVHVIVGTGPPDEVQEMLTLSPEMTLLLISPVVLEFAK